MKMNQRQYSFLDRVLSEVNRGINTLFSSPTAQRKNPAFEIIKDELSSADRQQSGRLMRINHCGEVCAQALYFGQLISASNPETLTMLKRAADEESDHLAWTRQRLKELKTHPSYLNFAWYLNSFMIGLLAGLAGDKYSLGFVEETERQVSIHLSQHLKNISNNDLKSKAIIEQMRADEECHGRAANLAGAMPLPFIVTEIMKLQAKMMTSLTYWI